MPTIATPSNNVSSEATYITDATIPFVVRDNGKKGTVKTNPNNKKEIIMSANAIELIVFDFFNICAGLGANFDNALLSTNEPKLKKTLSNATKSLWSHANIGCQIFKRDFFY